VCADAVHLSSDLAKILGGKAVTLDAENRISRIVLPGHEWEIDLTSFTGSIEQDLARRDFTINAMAYDLEEAIFKLDENRCIDPYGGREDLRRSLVCAVDDTTFSADPARLLRAVRIAAELGFTIETATEHMIQRDSRLVTDVAGERHVRIPRRLALRSAERLCHLDRQGPADRPYPEPPPARLALRPAVNPCLGRAGSLRYAP
jgi:poly(A) polymerase